MQKTTIRRTLGTLGPAAAALLAASALVLASPLAASAHVRVNPDQATPGSYSTLTFKVPNEMPTGNTVKLEVDLPTDTPFGSVSYEPVPGWATEVVTSTLAKPVTTDDGTVTEAPTKVTWTADANGGIPPGAFQTFSISVGPVPDTGSIVLPAHQTYSDGTVVDWATPTPASGEEPENPAPTLYITDAPPVDADSSAMPGMSTGGPSVTEGATPGSGSGSGSGTDAAGSAAGASAGSDPLAVGLGIGGLALGAIALVVAVFGLTRSRAPRA